MSSPKLIPIPLKQRMNSLRMKVVPLFVFAAAAIMAALLWKDAVSPAMLVGEVATTQSSLSSPITASVQRLHVTRLQLVKAGDVLTELVPADPRQALDLLQNELTLLRAQTDAQNSQRDAASAQRRETMDYERLRVDLMTEKVALVKAQTAASQAQIAYDVAKNLTKDDAASSKRYLEEAQLAKTATDTELSERKGLVDELTQRLAELQKGISAPIPSSDSARQKAMLEFEKELQRLQTGSTTVELRAPMDGMVTSVLRRQGENVVAGDPIIVITATKAEKIVGYLRQPFPLEPEVGMEVEIRTNNRARSTATAQLTGVGLHFEPILNTALHPAPTPEVGLPLEVSIPTSLKLRPGELVSLVIRQK
jgi:multidrug resistance efflux pump